MKTLNNYISERLNPRNLGPSDTLPEELKEKYKLIYNSGTYRYDCDGNIDTKGDLIKNGHFICNFGIIKGYFTCAGYNLKTLKGAPEEVGGYFDCTECKMLESLEGAPGYVGDDFFCEGCENLETLEGAPEKVGK